MILDEPISFNIFKYVGKRIYFYRKQTRLSRDSFVEKMERTVGEKMSVYNLGMIERGMTNPTLKTLYNIAQTLHVELKDLFE